MIWDHWDYLGQIINQLYHTHTYNYRYIYIYNIRPLVVQFFEVLHAQWAASTRALRFAAVSLAAALSVLAGSWAAAASQVRI